MYGITVSETDPFLNMTTNNSIIALYDKALMSFTYYSILYFNNLNSIFFTYDETVVQDIITSNSNYIVLLLPIQENNVYIENFSDVPQLSSDIIRLRLDEIMLPNTIVTQTLASSTLNIYDLPYIIVSFSNFNSSKYNNLYSNLLDTKDNIILVFYKKKK